MKPDAWHPPKAALTWLTAGVTLFAVVAVALTTAYLLSFVSQGELPPITPSAVWLLCITVAVTGGKAWNEWRKE